MNPGTISDQLPPYAASGYAINETLVIMVAASESPIAQPGMDRSATK
jgi:hypothetical protein